MSSKSVQLHNIKNVLFVTDLHKRESDYSSIKNYREAIRLVQQDILDFCLNNDNTVLISCGDWYDKGYKSVDKYDEDTNYDRYLSMATGGNFYICIGNHLYIERDSNPELYMIQPSDYVQTKTASTAIEPVIKTVSDIVIGDTQISFFHYSRDNKWYINDRKPGIKLHIGVYHDESVLPSSIRESAGIYGTSTSSSYLTSIYGNVDIAIVGHVHKSFSPTLLTLESGKQIQIIVPGAMAITQNSDNYKHRYVDCPLLTFEEDGSCAMSYYRISTHMDKLRFFNVKEKSTYTFKEKVKATSSDLSQVKIHNTIFDYLMDKRYDPDEIFTLNNYFPGDYTIDDLKEVFRRWEMRK